MFDGVLAGYISPAYPNEGCFKGLTDFHRFSPPLAPEPEGQVDQSDHHRHLHQRADNG